MTEDERKRWIEKRDRLQGMSERLSNTWQQTIGKIELINELLEEGTASQPPAV